MWYLLLALISTTYAAEPTTSKPSAAPEGPAKQVLLSTAPGQRFQGEIPYNILDSQFQFSDFNYIPEKQHFPRIQPQGPVIIYTGAAPPGQQFLYRSGPPPGNFLVPQPQPQPHPGPGVVFGGNPPGTVFLAGYPRPAHIPPIEKDAEEIPGLAGNHPVSNTGRPVKPRTPAIKPEKLETFDEPAFAGEADVLAEADKTPNNIVPRGYFPTAAAPKPGHQFFILNGHPLYSNYPLGAPAAPPPPTFRGGIPPQGNPGYFVYPQQQYVPELQPQQFHDPIQDLFLRNSVTGQISDVKPVPHPPTGYNRPLYVDHGNYISLNAAEDFRQNYFLRNPSPISGPSGFSGLSSLSGPSGPSGPSPQQNINSVLEKQYELSPIAQRISLIDEKAPLRIGKEFELNSPVGTLDRGGFSTFDSYYRYAPTKISKEEDDSVVIDAKVQDDDAQVHAEVTPEGPSLSQAQPSAIALAGKGGVASAGPRGTALVGNKGLAVSIPQATAVAGPSREEEKKSKTKKERQQ